MGWQPIETAPKDGNWILLCNRAYYPEGITAGWWSKKKLAWVDVPDGDRFDCEFTDWTPLPSHPVQS